MVGMVAAGTDLAEAGKHSAGSENCCVVDTEDCYMVEVDTAQDILAAGYYCPVVGMVLSSWLASLLANGLSKYIGVHTRRRIEATLVTLNNTLYSNTKQLYCVLT